MIDSLGDLVPYRLSRSTFLAINSIIITYLIVMQQFRVSDFAPAPGESQNGSSVSICGQHDRSPDASSRLKTRTVDIPVALMSLSAKNGSKGRSMGGLLP